MDASSRRRRAAGGRRAPAGRPGWSTAPTCVRPARPASRRSDAGRGRDRRDLVEGGTKLSVSSVTGVVLRVPGDGLQAEARDAADSCPRGRRPARGGRRRAGMPEPVPGSPAGPGSAAGRLPRLVLGAAGGRDTRRARPLPRVPGRRSCAPAPAGNATATNGGAGADRLPNDHAASVSPWITPKIRSARAAPSGAPPILSRYLFPEHWRAQDVLCVPHAPRNDQPSRTTTHDLRAGVSSCARCRPVHRGRAWPPAPRRRRSRAPCRRFCSGGPQSRARGPRGRRGRTSGRAPRPSGAGPTAASLPASREVPTRLRGSRSGSGRGQASAQRLRGTIGAWRAKSSADEEPAPIPRPSVDPRRAPAAPVRGRRRTAPADRGRWIGFGSRTRACSRRWILAVVGRPRRRPRSRASRRTPSTRRRTARSVGNPRPATVSSSAGAPSPTPTVSRPPVSLSSAAISFASRTGCRRPMTITAIPRRGVRVTAAAYARSCRPSSIGAPEVGPPTALSIDHRPVNPSASARIAYAATGLGSSPSNVWGRPTENRVSMVGEP